MRSQGRCRWCRVGAVLLLSTCGCVGHMFGGAGGAAHDGGLAAPWQGGAARTGGKLGQAPAVPAQQLTSPAPANEQISLMSNRLQATEDDRRVLAARLQQLESRLQEKEKVIVLSNYEVQEAARQVSQTRDELKRWKQEMETLRTQLRSSEKENKGTLETMIRTLEQFMEREKEAGKGSR
jgi:chromosome segregation ATPase